MAKCEACGREMTTATGCRCKEVEINGEWFPRIRFGRKGDLTAEFAQMSKGDRCGDCGCRVGYFHHPGCDMEACPVCGEQLISCIRADT